jgi:heme exporter protein D
MSEFLSMGGYGFFVWGSYAVTFAALALEVLFLVRRAKNCDPQANRMVK